MIYSDAVDVVDEALEGGPEAPDDGDDHREVHEHVQRKKGDVFLDAATPAFIWTFQIVVIGIFSLFVAPEEERG